MNAVQRGVAAVLRIAGVAFLLWGAALLFVQCLYWLKVGAWQPVPAFAVFLSAEAQTFNLRVTSGAVATPLDLAPSVANFDSLDGVTVAMTGSLVGLGKIVGWLLNTPFSIWLFVAAMGCTWWSLALEDAGRVKTRPAA
jgi:hypothetical protein